MSRLRQRAEAALARHDGRVLTLTLESAPVDATHWSTRSMDTRANGYAWRILTNNCKSNFGRRG